MYKSKSGINNDLHTCDLEYLTYEKALMREKKWFTGTNNSKHVPVYYRRADGA